MKIYIIDDEYVSVFITQNILQKAGFSENITAFSSAEEALDILVADIENEVPEIIFLDLNMPGMNGWDFLENLETYKDQLLGRCQIYILTSSLDTSDISKAENVDLVSGFIHKPIDRDDIEVILQKNNA